MWNRIEYAEWVAVIPIIAFVLTFSVFVILVTRAMCMKKTRIAELSRLPLDQEPPGKPEARTDS